MSDDISDGPWAQRVYLTWPARDTRYALAALDALIDSAQNAPVPPGAWVCFEDFLSFPGKVSRTLWPAQGKGPSGTDEGLERRKKRGPFLRKILEVEDSSPLKARKARKGSEHFDERLDEWVVSTPRPTVEEWQADTKPMFPAPPTRLIDAKAGTVHVAGADLDLRFMAEELQRLRPRSRSLSPQ
ncbi:hypothetical protein [Streptomyces pulveraceus]|uniref:Uncharacterized protein n=1 Tax=Streptomyces pulveraceus TaxID=68258 RepID=A0ABW1GPB3_9ACTN